MEIGSAGTQYDVTSFIGGWWFMTIIIIWLKHTPRRRIFSDLEQGPLFKHNNGVQRCWGIEFVLCQLQLSHTVILCNAITCVTSSLLSTTMSKFPDYYQLLGILPAATPDEIRQAYKRESLKTHPDRLSNASAAEKQRATERFQVRLQLLLSWNYGKLDDLGGGRCILCPVRSTEASRV